MKDVGDPVLRTLADHGIDALSAVPVSGGDISAAFRVTDQDHRILFVKSGERSVLNAERTGLATLVAAPHRLVIPRPRAIVSSGTDRALLIMDWLESQRSDDMYWEELGRGLAELHAVTSESFGFLENNFVGRLPQQNSTCKSWVEFFLDRRLEPQVRMALDRGLWSGSWTPLHMNLQSRLPQLIPDSPSASLVHGDLWGGNAMATTAGPAIIDPAVYYGHREVDLAMSELFGGFSTRFYDAYKEASPLEDGYQDRRDLYNLYHVLNHLNHFGSGYAGSVERSLLRYGG